MNLHHELLTGNRGFGAQWTALSRRSTAAWCCSTSSTTPGRPTACQTTVPARGNPRPLHGRSVASHPPRARAAASDARIRGPARVQISTCRTALATTRVTTSMVRVLFCPRVSRAPTRRSRPRRHPTTPAHPQSSLRSLPCAMGCRSARACSAWVIRLCGYPQPTRSKTTKSGQRWASLSSSCELGVEFQL